MEINYKLTTNSTSLKTKTDLQKILKTPTKEILIVSRNRPHRSQVTPNVWKIILFSEPD